MHICFSCAKPIDASICLYQKNYYHANCCRICTPNPVVLVKEKAPPMPPTTPKPLKPYFYKIIFKIITLILSYKNSNYLKCLTFTKIEGYFGIYVVM